MLLGRQRGTAEGEGCTHVVAARGLHTDSTQQGLPEPMAEVLYEPACARSGACVCAYAVCKQPSRAYERGQKKCRWRGLLWTPVERLASVCFLINLPCAPNTNNEK